MSLKNLSYFIDIKNFPINEPESAKYKKIVKEAQEALEFDGCYVLPSIVNKEAINDTVSYTHLTLPTILLV